ncbi:MAG: hypothetical protein DMF71_08390 [Acidobacteria bacterium]|nr:MAG: hypothetical protein DMF71_08390 [Acidobacteriota bacterium]
MKCDDCINLLEQYVDGEASEPEGEQVGAHLVACAACANQFELLTAEQEAYARYDRELEISPALWKAIAARTIAENGAADSRERLSPGKWLAGLLAMPRFGFALPAMAVVILAVMFGVVFLRTRKSNFPVKQETVAQKVTPSPVTAVVNVDKGTVTQPSVLLPANPTDKRKGQSTAVNFVRPQSRSDQPDVIETALDDFESKDTATHLEQAQNLLVSFRSLKFSDDDAEVDVSYEKSESRRLLNENIVLRRDAEMAGKFPVKSVLGSLEPFLIDIANLPDKASPSDVRQIKDRVQRTEIVAELRSY